MNMPRGTSAPPAAEGATVGNEGWVRLDLPASHRYLTLVGACLSELLARADGLPEPEVTTYNVQLAAQEICVNIVDHAYRGRQDGRINIYVALLPARRELVVELRDTGVAFDPEGVPMPNLEQGQEHGYGLFLALQLMDSVKYERLPEGNRWQLVKNW
jgi:serine/threonine-protein kinase RsbW